MCPVSVAEQTKIWRSDEGEQSGKPRISIRVAKEESFEREKRTERRYRCGSLSLGLELQMFVTR